ncbi:S49 family peptidase [Natrinema salaciae]|uniref:Protease-4 n=1 Tax=Natrinema salaciae TaxID=1186196 RepID=A0A1H9AH04_9EURY|nr:S49 family peptidase [Natrinema salaciae]SEP76016.1 protease-4 [Natrinema salaciae]
MVFWPLERLSRRQQIALAAVFAVAAGALVAPQVYGETTDDDGIVAVIEVSGTIDANTAQEVETELRNARHNESVEAVVLDVNSGGGAPGSSERMYMAVERTAEEMPVIAAVDTVGASGAYYTMLPADEIYVTPTGEVGSVGVIGPAPQPTGPNEGASAPDKGTFHPDDHRAQTETIKRAFLESVMEQRGDELELSREEVAHAQTYPGVEAVENGYADEIGTVDDAIGDVADEAGMGSYEVDIRESEQPQRLPLGLEGTARDGDAVETAGTTLNPNRPLLVTTELWNALFDRDGAVTADDRTATNADPTPSTADNGGEQT